MKDEKPYELSSDEGYLVMEFGVVDSDSTEGGEKNKKRRKTSSKRKDTGDQ